MTIQQIDVNIWYTNDVSKVANAGFQFLSGIVVVVANIFNCQLN